MMAVDTAAISLVRGWYCVVRMPHDAQVRRISWIVGSVGWRCPNRFLVP